MARLNISYVNLGTRWGIRVHPAGSHRPGDTVQVLTKGGKIKQERLGSKHMSSGGTDYFNKATGPQTTSREEFDREAIRRENDERERADTGYGPGARMADHGRSEVEKRAVEYSEAHYDDVGTVKLLLMLAYMAGWEARDV